VIEERPSLILVVPAGFLLGVTLNLDHAHRLGIHLNRDVGVTSRKYGRRAPQKVWGLCRSW
jgi:hypothetical protein